MEHPEWCDLGRCDVGQVGGRHRGKTTPVGNPDRPLTTIWLDQVPNGPVRVAMAVGLTIPTWAPEDALRVAAAIERVAGSAVRARVG